jgi:hypothetical protein
MTATALYTPDTVASSTTRTTAAKFIKELWSDEVLAVYKANTVMVPLIQSMPFSGQKGDTVHIPKPSRGSVTAKSAGTGVTLITETATHFDLTVATHYEYSRLIEDIAKIQALDSMRSFYTDDAGYAHAISLDSAIHTNAATWSGGDSQGTPGTAGAAYSKAVIGGDGDTTWVQTGSGNGSALTDAGIRRAIQHLDDQNVPARQRCLVVPPVEKRRLLGLSRFTEQAFVGEVAGSNSIRNGLIGDIYGVPVYVSTNCATVDSSDCTSYRACLLFQKEVAVLAEQLAPRSQSQYKQEFLADLFTVDTIYGLGAPRPYNGIPIMVPA